MEEDGRYITVQEAQDILHVSARQVQYHAANERIRSKKQGRRLLVHEGDVLQLAEELGSDLKKDPQPSVEMVHDQGPLIDYMREKDQQLLLMSRRIGELESLLQQRLLPEDEQGLRERLMEAEMRARLLEEELTRLRETSQAPQESWWKRIFG